MPGGRGEVLRDRHKRLVVLAVAIGALAVLSGCVYYNTFYHAKVAAREAETMRENRAPDSEPTVHELELLERAIEKSGRVLRLHPDSEWADDALLLMAESLHHKGQNEVAEDRLTEFLALYPESELRTRAEYTLAGVMLAEGNAVSAEDLLRAIAYAEPPHELSDDALVIIGEARRQRGRHVEAAEAYEELLQRFPESDRRAEARFLAAENYSEMKLAEEAARQYAAVAEESGGRELIFEARLRLAETYLDLESIDDALSVLRDLEGRTVNDEDLDKVLLLIGRAQTDAGELESAVLTYEGIAASRERTAAAAEAHYRIGLIRRDELRSLDAALESFETARAQAPRSDAAKLAEGAKRDLESLKRYLDTIEEHESAPPATEEAPAETLTTSAPDTAATRGTTVSDTLSGGRAETTTAAVTAPPTDSAQGSGDDAPADGDTTGYAPADGDTTGYAAADGDTTGYAPADGDTTGYATADGDTTGYATADGDSTGYAPASEVAEARFRAAELYLFKLDDPESALGYYEDVIALHARSALAPKAALARAWLFTMSLGDSGRGASAYRYVIANFPGTVYSEAAEEALMELSKDAGDGAD